jgi:hypothetical protein
VVADCVVALLLQTARSITRYQSTQNHRDLKKAKDMTKAEFRDNFKQMLWALHKKLADCGISMQEFQPWFSWDHNFAQEYADLHFKPEEVPPGMDYVTDLDFTNVRMPLPKYSPDCHRVIEHVFGQLSHKLRTAIVTQTHLLSTSPEVAAWLKQQFYQLDPASIAADAAGLPSLYKWIRDNDGCWAPRSMR